MAWREGRKRGGGSIDLDLSPQDGSGAPPGDSSAAPNEPSERPNKKPANRGAPRRRRRSADAAPRQSRNRKRTGGKRTGRTRSMLGRAAYWGALLALWALIGGIGALAWIGIRLPPIQSLEIPKRPPAGPVLGVKGATPAARRRMGRAPG